MMNREEIDRLVGEAVRVGHDAAVEAGRRTRVRRTLYRLGAIAVALAALALWRWLDGP